MIFDWKEVFTVGMAFNSLNKGQIAQIEKHTSILYSNLETIEKYGGGSARCMMAEVFLPKE